MKKNKNFIDIVRLMGASVLGGALNFAYHPVMLYFLDVVQFGEFETLMSLFSLLGVVTTGFLYFLNKEVSRYQEDTKKVSALFTASMIVFGLCGIVLYLLYVLGAGHIGSYLRIDDKALVLGVGLIIIFGFIGMPLEAVMRGLGLFKQKSQIMSIVPVIKLTLGAFFVWLGREVYGAVGGLIMASLIGFSITLRYVMRYISLSPWKDAVHTLLGDMWQMKWELIHYFLGSFFFAVLLNADILIAKNMFDATTVGLYATVSVIAKFLVFLLMAVETVYYSQAMKYIGSKIPPHIIENPMLLFLVGGTIARGGAYVVGPTILSLINPDLLIYSDVLTTLVGYAMVLGVVGFLSKILIGYRRRWSNLILGVGVCVILGWIYRGNAITLGDMATIFLVSSSVMMVCLWMMVSHLLDS